MIGNVTSASPHVMVGGGSSSTYVNGHAGAQGVGNVRYNTSIQKMEVYDGSTWQSLNLGAATVGLTSAADTAINWVISKMYEEDRLRQLAKDHPIMQDLLEQRNKINEQLKVAENLVKEY